MTKKEQAIDFIKNYRKLDEHIHNTVPKDTIAFVASKQCLEFWDMAIQALSQWTDKECRNWYDVSTYEMTLEQARQVVKDLRKIVAKLYLNTFCGTASRGFLYADTDSIRCNFSWIPVKYILPKENKTVIASTDDNVFPQARYSKEYGWEWCSDDSADYWEELKGVTAWMQLPDIYKAESEV